MPLILPGNVASATASTTYDVDNSCRFNRASSESLERTPGSAGNRRTFTFSCWFKLGNLASSQSDYYQLFGGFNGTGNDGLWISDSDKLYIYLDSGERRITNQVIRDPSAWYNAVLAIDTTQGTAANRIKLYLNGSEITSFSTNSDPTLNYDSGVNDTSLQNIGERVNDDYLDGYIAEAVLIDGQQLTPTSFGEFDSDSPTIWKPIDVSGLTFGTNGFYLDFEDSSALGNDVSGNDNDFTVNNLAATDQASDSPTNNFATLNPLVPESIGTFSEGNCKNVSSSSTNFGAVSTFGVSSGKWYAEFKPVTATGDKKRSIGVCGDLARNSGWRSELYLYSFNTQGDSGASVQTTYDGSSDTDTDVSSAYNGYFENDIVGVALDMDNNKVYFSIDGTWQNSADPAAGTNGVSIGASPPDGVFYFAVMDVSSSDVITYEANFGNPPYANSSSTTDANGYGDFEYAVPSGYYALCTKNIGAYGG